MTKPRYAATVLRLPRLAVFEARGAGDALEAAIRKARLPWPTAFSIVAASGGVDVARIGPKRVLIMAPDEFEDDLTTRLEKAFPSAVAADFAMLSDSFEAFAIEGADAEQILRQGAPLNLSSQAFPPGAIAGTELWATTAIVARLAAPEPAFRVLVEASYAGYIENWLAFANGLPSSKKPGTMLRPPGSLKP